MTSLQPAATDPSLPGPPADSAGSSPPPDVPRQAPAAVPTCSIAAAAEAVAAASGTSDRVFRQGARSRHDSVPQPRGRDDADALVLPAVAPVGTRAADPAADPDGAEGGPTAARLRAAFAERLRAARAEGRSVAELADACRRPVAEVRALLGETAEDGADAPEVAGAGPRAEEAEKGTGIEVGFVRLPSATVPSQGGPFAPTRRPVREEARTPGSLPLRPSPSRRLRRMHPQAAPSGQEATARETAASGPAGADPGDGPAWTGERADPVGTVADPAPFGAGTAGDPGAEAGPAPAPYAEPPLGVLIGGSPGQPESVGRPEERAPVRVVAEPVRVGRGTSLVVLPTWRPAIAVSVSTEQLLSATGLAFEELSGARLTVLMNPSALHDRELELHGWEPGPTARGRRGARS
ncbi:hypothetical protein ACIRD3_23675 [Kitasatospora sp. NPDC093550]|uniref:hypothetical protein n=1 Tax=Kitasatospora sp. NPDC093550 TaxID=3364089 RepID=UPI00380A4D4A